MQPENIYRSLIERIESKINGVTQQPNIQLKPLSSFANSVYKVQVIEDSHVELNNKTFLFKIFRQYLAEFSNKSVENEVVTILSKHNMYPQVFYTDKNHRIEEFISGYAPGTQNVTQNQMIQIMQRLAGLVKLFDKYAQSKTEYFQNERKIAQMFPIFENVAKQCQQLHPDSYQVCKGYVQAILSQNVRNQLQKIVPKAMVPTHNDCHFHNVLIRNKDHRLFLIDFQFFSPNYRGFQLGNFFNEYATDYHTFQIKEELELPKETKDLLISKYYDAIGSGLSLDEAGKEVEVGRLLSHLFWLFIGVKQVKDPKITIDMQYYIRRRYQQFMKIYQKFASK